MAQMCGRLERFHHSRFIRAACQDPSTLGCSFTLRQFDAGGWGRTRSVPMAGQHRRTPAISRPVDRQGFLRQLWRFTLFYFVVVTKWPIDVSIYNIPYRVTAGAGPSVNEGYPVGPELVRLTSRPEVRSLISSDEAISCVIALFFFFLISLSVVSAAH